MPTRTGYGAPQLPHRPQHKPRPEQNQIPRLTALTPQNQPERPLLRGNETIRIVLKPFNAFVVQDFEIVTKSEQPSQSSHRISP